MILRDNISRIMNGYVNKNVQQLLQHTNMRKTNNMIAFEYSVISLTNKCFMQKCLENQKWVVSKVLSHLLGTHIISTQRVAGGYFIFHVVLLEWAPFYSTFSIKFTAVCLMLIKPLQSWGESYLRVTEALCELSCST